MLLRSLAVVLLLSFTACESDTPSAERAPADTPLHADTAAVTTTDEAPALVLDGEGIRFVAPASGSARLLPFDADKATVVPALSASLGAPASDVTNPECPAGALEIVSWRNGFAAFFYEGRFVGWEVDGRDEGADLLTTAAGVGTGTTYAAVREAYDAEPTDTSVGVMLDLGGLYGLFEARGDEEQVHLIWAGTNCMFT